MSIRTRVSGGVTTARNTAEERFEAVAGAVDRNAIKAGVVATFLLGLMSLIIPIVPFFGVITGGVAGGFVAAYATGGLVRGTVHGIVAALVGGIMLSVFGVAQALILGFVFTQTPTLIGSVVLVPGILSNNPLVAVIASLTVVPVFVGFDGAVGGVVGSAVKGVRDLFA